MLGEAAQGGRDHDCDVGAVADARLSGAGPLLPGLPPDLRPSGPPAGSKPRLHDREPKAGSQPRWERHWHTTRLLIQTTATVHRCDSNPSLTRRRPASGVVVPSLATATVAPANDLATQPESSAAPDRVVDRFGHIRIPLLVLVHRVRLRQAEQHRHIMRIGEVVDINHAPHALTL